MREALLKLLPVALFATLLVVSASSAQDGRAQALVGFWEGGVDGTGGDPNRTLVIVSVSKKYDRWVASGYYGITGKSMGYVDVTVDDSGGQIVIRFTTASNTKITLSLLGTQRLTGTFAPVTGRSSASTVFAMNLEIRELGSAEDGLGQALIGIWDGTVDATGGNPSRTLLVVWVGEEDGKSFADGRYGITGRGLEPVDIEVDNSGDRIVIRFMTGTNSRVHLLLVGTQHLTGTLKITDGQADRRMRLEKMR